MRGLTAALVNAIATKEVKMTEKSSNKALLLGGMLSIMVAVPSAVFAAEASKCSGNGVANGAAWEHKVQNGVCDDGPRTAQVPEPSGLALLAGGVVAICARQMRKSKKLQ
jgi:hypothetical protein